MGHVPRTDGSTATLGTDEQFLQMVYADEDLLRAEFDAIIAAEWPSPPPVEPGSAGADGRPGPAERRGDTGAVLSPRAPHTGTGARARQRSPPAHGRGRHTELRKGR
jgi:hypothetical protein